MLDWKEDTGWLTGWPKRLKAVLTAITDNNISHQTVNDYGCGNRIAKDILKPITYYGYDILQGTNLEVLFPNSEADLGLFLGSLEYFKNPITILKKAQSYNKVIICSYLFKADRSIENIYNRISNLQLNDFYTLNFILYKVDNYYIFIWRNK